MAQDWSGLDYLERTFEYWAKEAMDDLAQLGESYAYMNAEWNDDTGSLRESITGYAADVGDPHANFGNTRWRDAQTKGNLAYQGLEWGYRNPPEHYAPEPDHPFNPSEPTAVVTTWTQYPIVGKPNDIPLGEAVSATLEDTLEMLKQQTDFVGSKLMAYLNAQIP